MLRIIIVITKNLRYACIYDAICQIENLKGAKGTFKDHHLHYNYIIHFIIIIYSLL